MKEKREKVKVKAGDCRGEKEYSRVSCASGREGDGESRVEREAVKTRGKMDRLNTCLTSAPIRVFRSDPSVDPRQSSTRSSRPQRIGILPQYTTRCSSSIHLSHRVQISYFSVQSSNTFGLSARQHQILFKSHSRPKKLSDTRRFPPDRIPV
jgi:hypothetical protein